MLAQGERKFARILEENDKKFLWSLAKSEREKKFQKSFEKMFEQIKTEFLKKLDSQCSIDRKIGSINQT